jgi:hypothetical protein
VRAASVFGGTRFTSVPCRLAEVGSWKPLGTEALFLDQEHALKADKAATAVMAIAIAGVSPACVALLMFL